MSQDRLFRARIALYNDLRNEIKQSMTMRTQLLAIITALVSGLIIAGLANDKIIFFLIPITIAFLGWIVLFTYSNFFKLAQVIRRTCDLGWEQCAYKINEDTPKLHVFIPMITVISYFISLMLFWLTDTTKLNIINDFWVSIGISILFFIIVICIVLRYHLRELSRINTIQNHPLPEDELKIINDGLSEFAEIESNRYHDDVQNKKLSRNGEAKFTYDDNHRIKQIKTSGGLQSDPLVLIPFINTLDLSIKKLTNSSERLEKWSRYLITLTIILIVLTTILAIDRLAIILIRFGLG